MIVREWQDGRHAMTVQDNGVEVGSHGCTGNRADD